MRRLAILLAFASTSALAQPQGALNAPPPQTLANAPKLPPEWEAKARAVYKTAIETPTVAERGQVPGLVDYLAAQLKAGGWAPEDIHVAPYTTTAGNKTAALIARWPASGAARAKPLLILAHLDVVEALPGDWTTDPFKLVEKDGYFYGRGTGDDKGGAVPSMIALMKLRASGLKPNRDIVILYTGDEETGGEGATLGATDWRRWTDAEFALNADAGGGAFTRDGKPLGFGMQTSEKIFQTYIFRTRNPGGHSSRPRPDNAIYDLADALKKLQAHRFTPMLNETTRAYFTARAKQEGDNALGRAMRAWVANPKDGAAADAIEADPLEVGLTRTRCVATMLKGGHAENALPQLAEATVNCRIMPGLEPKTVEAELRQMVGPGVEVVPFEDAGRPTPVSPLRDDVVGAYTKAVHARFPNQPIIPQMSTGATDGLEFRARGIPVYGVDGQWGVSPDDERAHGKDERIPVQSLWDNVMHWESMIRDLAG
ncbi:M20/M25/M40 family metallo-hydrolase [Sphingomonas sinipercae]|uniref:M20/M25/M40 family metallo-hydrolase n=1 Tax=Sphingomonas sinipercae TaxID=2714944 RepID=A0A6G7ZQ68_9SPHN|nr:M20/M25/M40 family metallo-hydrolase [Sphingomonas sinipercae]QIL03046.1 M20/M25/M40 family metallo-hydrolase [Sphingomonas sinipercae]